MLLFGKKFLYAGIKPVELHQNSFEQNLLTQTKRN